MSVLKDIVPRNIYEHFLSLTVSISVLLYFKPNNPTYLEKFQLQHMVYTVIHLSAASSQFAPPSSGCFVPVLWSRNIVGFSF